MIASIEANDLHVAPQDDPIYGEKTSSGATAELMTGGPKKLQTSEVGFRTEMDFLWLPNESTWLVVLSRSSESKIMGFIRFRSLRTSRGFLKWGYPKMYGF